MQLFYDCRGMALPVKVLFLVPGLGQSSGKSVN
jgi:hypothetical protein